VGAAEIGCTNWAQFLLKFIVAHPDVTCEIPANEQCRACAGEHGHRTRHPLRQQCDPFLTADQRRAGGAEGLEPTGDQARA
jgi:hypothetical protein